jgi:hypothetical protein
MFGGQNENSDDLETVIDKEDNVFVMSNRKTKYPTLQLDLRSVFIHPLTSACHM